MAEVRVRPEAFANVRFDPARIAAVTAELCEQVGVDGVVEIEVDEEVPTGSVLVQSVDPLVVVVESGAIEDSRRPRQLSEEAVAEVVGRVLFRVADRRSDAFADAPADPELSRRERTAWNTYAAGRLARLGQPVNRQRQLYQFRTRHGFTDVADAAFTRLWNGAGLTWADVAGACGETEDARAAATA